jgi:hypothetical protein
MGSELSSFILEPALGIGIIALCILSIMEQNRGNVSYARWSAIGAIGIAACLILLNIMINVAG